MVGARLIYSIALFVSTPFLAKVLNFLQKIRFDINRVDPKYAFFHLLSKWSRDYFQSRAKGTSPSLKNITASHIKELPFPLPYPDDPARSLAEQQRIVARIEALLAEVGEMRKLQAEIVSEIQALYRSLIFHRSDWNPQILPMSQLVRRIDTNENVEDDNVYQFAGVKSFGGGVFKGRTIFGRDTSYQRVTRLKAGNFTYPKLMAWEGALGSVPLECDGLVVSPEYPVFEVDENIVLPEVLDVYFRTQSIWPTLAALSTGTNARRRRLHPDVFLTYEFPVPPMKVQQYLREAVRSFDGTEDMKETQKLLNELEPAVLNQAFRGEL